MFSYILLSSCAAEQSRIQHSPLGMALTEGIVLSPSSLGREKRAGPGGLCWERAGKGRQGQESAGKDMKSKAVKSALRWDLGAGGGS